jgi:Domain of unknown function (DUF4937
MLVKWITCRVAPADRQRFSAAQERCAPIAQEPGFICQVGGLDSADTACVLALWEERDAYGSFMRERHDAILEAAAQPGTYRDLRVATGEVLLEMPGAAAGTVAALTRAQLVRVADCRVRPARDDHFRAAQREVWLPGMSTVDGMLGGLFGRLDDHRYLVATGSRDRDSHERYRNEHVPGLIRRAEAESDLLQLEGHAVRVADGWTLVAG